jgi:SPP1 gp7 family putative phage head morphogenesis protein
MINKKTLTVLNKYLDKKDLKRLQKNAEIVNKLEQDQHVALGILFDNINSRVEQELIRTGRLPNLDRIDFEGFFANMIFQAMNEGIKETETSDIDTKPKEEKRLAKKDRWSIPTTLKDLMKVYDDYRKRGNLPAKIKKIADSVKKEYLKKTQSVWQKYSKDFLQGNVQEREEVVAKIKKVGQTTKSRAGTIVNTETTNYYNQVRKNIYDQSPDVVGYLFMAIRDAATSKWCTNKTIKGYRGRGGLVFKKGTKLLQRNTPSCHWHCRSDLLPLTMQNSNHRKLLLNESLWAENHKLTPLPPGWKST